MTDKLPTPPALDTAARVGDDPVRNAHVDVLKHWKSVLAETHTPLLPTAEPTSIGYIAWFIDSAIDLAPSLPLTKLARWVGFIQGILASHNYLNVKAERDRTRPIFECERRSIPTPTARAEALEACPRWHHIVHCPTDGSEWEMRLSDGTIFTGRWNVAQKRWQKSSEYEPAQFGDETIKGRGKIWANLPDGIYPTAYRALSSAPTQAVTVDDAARKRAATAVYETFSQDAADLTEEGARIFADAALVAAFPQRRKEPLT